MSSLNWCGLLLGFSMLFVQGCAGADPSAAQGVAQGSLAAAELGLESSGAIDLEQSPLGRRIVGWGGAAPPPACLVEPNPCVWLDVSSDLGWALFGFNFAPDARLPRVKLVRLSDGAELELQPEFESDGTAFFASAASSALVSKRASRLDRTLPAAAPRCGESYVVVVESPAQGSVLSNGVTLPDCTL